MLTREEKIIASLKGLAYGAAFGVLHYLSLVWPL